jgi:hypothetical protein
MQSGADIVIGSRMAGADSEMPLTRRVGNIIFARLVNIISVSDITDSASGMRIFRKSILEKLYPLPDGLNLTPVMSTRALHEKMRMVEVPIPYSERVGRSKLSVVRDGMRFGQSIVWTALNYNPVRPLGIMGLVLLGIATLIGLVLVIARFQGITTVSPLAASALYFALVAGVAGISILALGYSFNYFVALFHKEPVQQGLFGKTLLRNGIDKHFGWVGLVSLALGASIGIVSAILAARGWTITQLWIYYLGSASLALIGIQLVIAWVQMQVLEALRVRESLAASDMKGKERKQIEEPVLAANSLQPQH